MTGVLLLGLGIGAATSIFSVVETVLFEPFVPQEDRVFVLCERKSSDEVPAGDISLPHFFDWRERNTSFADMAAFGPSNVGYTLLLEPGEPAEVMAAQVSPSFFDTLGVPPFLGRGFQPEEDQPDSDHVVVLSYGFWQEVLGGDERVLGRTLTMEQDRRDAYTVVGVMPKGFSFPREARFWTPVRKEEPVWPGRGFGFLFAVGRLTPGVTAERAASELDTLIPQIYRENDFPEAEDRRVHMLPLSDYFLGENTRSALWILQSAVAMLFLIACINVASLFLVRNSSRHKEAAIRTALGASRIQIARAFLVETAAISFAGAGLGIVLAHAALTSILAIAPSSVPRFDQIEMDGSVFFFALVIAAAAAVLVAIGPALGVTRPSSVLRQLRHFFVAWEIAATVVLVIGASLLMGSLFRLMRTDLGYRPEGLLLLSVKGPAGKYGSVPAERSLIRRSMDRIEGLGEVSSVGAVLVPPFSAGALGWDIWWVAESQNAPWDTMLREDPETGEMLTYSLPSREVMEANPPSNWEVVSGSYFEAMGIPLLRGRTFNDQDTEEAPRVVIVSETFAKKLWPGEDPIGKRIITLGHRSDESRRSEWQIVVGMVGEASYRELTGTRMDLYVPYQQSPFVPAALAVRYAVDPPTVVEGIRAALKEIDPEIRLEHVRTMESVLDRERLPWRFHTTLVTAFAGVALVLASLGVFGMVAHSVAQRTREIGLRMAIGARNDQVTGLVVREGMRPVLLGLVAGLGLALLCARLLSAHLYEVAPTDPMTYGGVGVLMAIVAGLACYLPARRAARIDPAAALRCE